MIEQDTSHRDQVFADQHVTNTLLEAQAESVVQNWHFSQKPFGKEAARRYWQRAKDQQAAMLARAERPPDEGPFDTRPPDQRDQVVREHEGVLKNRYIEGTEAA